MPPKQAKPRSKVKTRPAKAVKKATLKVAKKAVKPAVKRAAPKSPAKKRQEKSRHIRLKLFVQEYLKANFNGTRAAIECGYSPLSARFQASVLLADPDVNALIDMAMKSRSERLEIDTDDILRRMHRIALADPRELIELHRGCCRFCYGKDNHYQWTPNELRLATIEYADAVKKADGDVEKLAKLRAPDVIGGTGFNPGNDPNPKCPECFGEGVERVVAKDTRDISPAAQMLYAGVKTTQNGMEIKMHDQTSMLVNVGKHLGMFTKNVKHTGDVNHHHATLSSLLEEVDGSGTGLPDNGHSTD